MLIYVCQCSEWTETCLNLDNIAGSALARGEDQAEGSRFSSIFTTAISLSMLRTSTKHFIKPAPL